MKQMSAERKAHIKASLAWQQFTRDADEVSNIMSCTMSMDNVCDQASKNQPCGHKNC